MIMFRINKTNQEQDPTTLKIVLILQKYALISGLRMSEGGNASDFKTFHWLLAATFILFLSGKQTIQNMHCSYGTRQKTLI